MTTVKEVLKMEQFKEATVIAGFNGLSRTVETITISELSDAADWLYGGEIVCTSGFIIKDLSTADSLSWIEGLAKKKASALLIKTSRFIGELPDVIIEFANKNDFPIINIPRDLTWPYLIEAVTELVSDKNIRELQKSQLVQDKLMKIVLNGGDVRAIAKELADLLKNPILVEDGILNTITKAIPKGTKVDKQVADERLKMRKSEGFKQKILRSSYYQKILSKKMKKIFELPLPNSDDSTSATIPIIANNTILGFLTIVEAGRRIVKSDLDSLEHGSNAIALKLSTDMRQRNSDDKNHSEQIKNLLNGRLNLNTPQNRFLYDSSALVVILLSVDIKQIERIDKKVSVTNAKQESEEIIRRHVEGKVDDYILGYEQNLFTLILPVREQTQETNINELQSLMTDCRSELKKMTSSNDIEIAIGTIHSSINDLKNSYENANATLDIISRTPHLGPIACTDYVGSMRLVYEFQDHEFLKDYRDYYIKNLLEEKTDQIFLETLTTYFHCGNKVKETAKVMFVHPNTIIYRLERIKELLGNSLQNPQYRESLSLAIQINNYLKSLEL